MPLIVTTKNSIYEITAAGSRFVGLKTHDFHRGNHDRFYAVGERFHFTHLVLFLGECATFGSVRTSPVVSIEESWAGVLPGGTPPPVCSITPGIEDRGFCR